MKECTNSGAGVGNDALREEILRLKKEKNAVILAHYYVDGALQDIADYVGDSLALAQKAADAARDADVVVMCGVNFMGETVKVLCPDKTVLMPDLEAGCSLADSCPAEEFAAFVAAHPGHTVISYVNTSIGVKALSDVLVTSSNARRIVESFPADEKIIFGPDRNLGSYINSVTDREMVLWDGACHVHEEFSLEKILDLKREHPGAKVVVHPECKAHVVAAADFVGSTAAILEYCGRSDAAEFIVVTEPGILAEMHRRYPGKRFIPAPPIDSTCGCNDCRYMKMITLENIAECLERMSPEVEIDEEIRRRAERSIRNMIAIR